MARRAGAGRHGAGGARRACRQQAGAGSYAQARAAGGRALGVRANPRARGRERKGAAGACGEAGWALLCAPRRASWASWVLVHPAWFSTRFFRLDIFRESLNEHCSL